MPKEQCRKLHASLTILTMNIMEHVILEQTCDPKKKITGNVSIDF